MKVEFFKPNIPNESIKEVIKTIESGWLTRGERTTAFEEKFRDYLGAKYCLAVNSGTSALHLSLLGLGIKAGDEVITTSMTWPATANVIEYVGAKTVFADIDKKTLNLDLNDIKKKVNSKTKAIIPVDLYGNPEGIQEIIEFAKSNNLYVVEDAAHAIEAIENNIKVGVRSTTTCFSFYANKNITTGEGGLVSTNDEELFLKMKTLSSSGISLDAWSKHSMELSKRRVTVDLGYKYNMFDLQAALGLHQLPLIEENWQKRHKKYQLYKEVLNNINGISLISHEVGKDSKHGHYILVISIDKNKTKQTNLTLAEKLKNENIATGIHYYPVHLHPYYKNKYSTSLNLTEQFSENLLSLPFYPDISEEEINYVAESLKRCLI